MALISKMFFSTKTKTRPSPLASQPLRSLSYSRLATCLVVPLPALSHTCRDLSFTHPGFSLTHPGLSLRPLHAFESASDDATVGAGPESPSDVITAEAGPESASCVATVGARPESASDVVAVGAEGVATVGLGLLHAFESASDVATVGARTESALGVTTAGAGLESASGASATTVETEKGAAAEGSKKGLAAEGGGVKMNDDENIISFWSGFWGWLKYTWDKYKIIVMVLIVCFLVGMGIWLFVCGNEEMKKKMETVKAFYELLGSLGRIFEMISKIFF